MNQNDQAAPSFDNTAADESQVGVQGIVHGDNYTYFLDANASPQEKLAKAKNCTAAMRAHLARKWIEELISDGHTDNETCYYWALSILSERPLADLSTDERAHLRRAFGCSAQNAEDAWSAPIRVVQKFVDCRLRQEQGGRTDPELLDDAVVAYQHLPEDRQNELQAHLGLVMTGAAQDRLDADYAERVRKRRLAPRRAERVWKFFEPVPEPPRPKVVAAPYLGRIEKTTGTCGAALFLCGSASTLVLALVQHPPFGLAMTFVLIGSGTLVAGLWPRQFPVRFSAFPSPAEFPDGRFSKAIEDTVRSEFHQQGWHAGAYWSTWNAQARRIREVLTTELVELYAAPPIAPGAVDWLIRWHAGETFRRWRVGELPQRGERPLVGIGFTLGVTGAVIGTFALLGAITTTYGGRIAFLALAILSGAALFFGSGLDAHLVRRHRHPGEVHAAQRRLTAEQAAYDRWCEVLADRPGDIEMARWLDDDKRYLLSMVRNQYGLANTDIVEHAFLTEPAGKAQRARVHRGVWRYTAYTLWLYLLTEAGVRQVRISLDFASGVLSNQRRTTFRYDAIASAGVKEVGVRADEGLKATTASAAGGVPKRLLRQDFHLALVNGESFEVTVKKAEEPAPGQPQDDLPWLARADLGASGVASTLRLLEEIAAEGGERVRMARRRREAPAFAAMPGSRTAAGGHRTNGGPADRAADPRP